MNSLFTIRKIYLMLGSACNLKCRHCYQTGADMPEPTNTVNHSVLDFLNEMAGIKSEPTQIVFWGGEPLLYRPLIERIVRGLPPQKFDFWLQTNGTLLTDEIVNFVNHYRIGVSVSCDGADTAKVRGVNVFDDPDFCERFCRIRRRCIGTTVHAYNIDPHALDEWIRARVGETDIHYQYTLECTFDMPKDLYAYDFRRYTDNLRRCRHEFIDDTLKGHFHTPAHNVLRRGVTGVMDFVTRREAGLPPRWWPECASMRHTLNLDLEGNLHLCHNRRSVIGHVGDPWLSLMENNDRMLKEAVAKKPECEKCDVNFLCRHGCPLNPMSPGQRVCCEAERIYWIQAVKTVQDAAAITTEIDL